MGDDMATGSILERLDNLRTALDKAGFVAEIVQSRSVSPFLRVTNPNVAQLGEAIQCGRHAAAGGALWFFWSWGEPMCPAQDVHRAAKELGHVVGDGE
jgi:hypothetical protein